MMTPGAKDSPEPMTKPVVGEDWHPDPPPPGCDCMVCQAKRERLAEIEGATRPGESTTGTRISPESIT